MAEIKWMGCAPNNFRRGRPAHIEVEAVVIHIIDGSQASADATFLNNTLANPRSAHYSVGRDGAIHQYVDETDTAYHAGKIVSPTWPQMKKAGAVFVNPNYYTLGIEHEAKADDEWTPAMYDSSAALLRAMSARYEALRSLTLANVVPHRAIRADKTCPGKADLNRLIALASGTPGTAPEPEPGVIVTTSSVNVRSGSPSTSAQVLRVLPADSLVHFVRKVKGDRVTPRDGAPNDDWYETVDGAFIWSGVTRQPSGGA